MSKSLVRCVGLMSGTSRDGVDAVVADIGDNSLEILAATTQAYPDSLAQRLTSLVTQPYSVSLYDFGNLHAAIGEAFADAALSVIDAAGVSRDSVEVIGSHGQTVWHAPDGPEGFSLQIGDAARIAARTGITTVADFRSGDVAVGGQGAPLVPPFHRWLFGAANEKLAVLNIGGIANVTLIDGEALSGFDTGPGNTLLDANIRRALGEPYDEDGDWAASGTTDEVLLQALLADPYFAEPPPKSTGVEYFNLDWLTARGGHDDADTQATLVQLTARTIADALSDFAPPRVLVCGGGMHNPVLIDALGKAMPGCRIDSTTVAGLNPDHVEAAAFAWLARQRIDGHQSNAPDVTGATSAASLGAIYRAPG